MKRVLYLAVATLVATMILVPTAAAQVTVEETVKAEGKLPKAGGPAPVGSLLLPAAALLVGSGVLAYAVLRRASR